MYNSTFEENLRDPYNYGSYKKAIILLGTYYKEVDIISWSRARHSGIIIIKTTEGKLIQTYSNNVILISE